MICDSEYSGHQELNAEQFFIDRSVTSQDTEADINLDLELVSRKDTNSSKSKFSYRLLVLRIIISHNSKKYFLNQLIQRHDQAKVTLVRKE